MKNMITNLCTAAHCKITQKLSDKQGLSELVIVAILIIVALIVAVVIFFPQISTWFKDVFMSGVTEKTNDLFNFTA